MLSLLIISENQDISKQYVKDLCLKENIDPFDISFNVYEGSIGVEEIRELQKKLYLKPLKGEIKAVIIVNAHTATREAQNALLKVLEEPPANTQIILTATTTQHFLPTVLSRCKIIDLDQKKQELSEKDQQTYQEEFENILSANIPQRLKFAQDIAADKRHMQEWLKNMILSLRSQILVGKFELTDSLYKLQETLNKLETTNINQRMLCENLLINLPLIFR